MFRLQTRRWLPQHDDDVIERRLRYAGRALSMLIMVALFAFVGAHVIDWLLGIDEAQPSGGPTGRDVVGFVALGILATGVIVGWWREALAAVVIAGGAIVFMIAVPAGLFLTVPFLLVAALYFGSWWREHGDEYA